jgi:hypothetical protein
MKQKLSQALQTPEFSGFLNDPKTFPILLKGASEDYLSYNLFAAGFNENIHLIPQFSFGARNLVDIAEHKDELTGLIEFGHQFSLQPAIGNEYSALNKLKSVSKSRLQPITSKADLVFVQVITDVVILNENHSKWFQHFSSRYGIKKSIKNRKDAEQRIAKTQEVVDAVNKNIGAPTGERITVKVENDFGAINMNFLIHGPYKYKQRAQVAKVHF